MEEPALPFPGVLRNWLPHSSRASPCLLWRYSEAGGWGWRRGGLPEARGLRVTIYASELPPNTPSNIAGGQWLPYGVFDFDKKTPEFMNQFLQATELAHRRYQTMLGPRYGVRWIRNY